MSIIKDRQKTRCSPAGPNNPRREYLSALRTAHLYCRHFNNRIFLYGPQAVARIGNFLKHPVKLKRYQDNR